MSLPIGPIDRLINIFSNAFLLPSAISVAYDLMARHEITWGPWETLIAGQMFTVGIEISFYLMAPLIMLLSPRWLILTFLAALGLHILPAVFHLPFRPWQYDFFPCMLAFFIAGRLSYLLYLRSLTWRFSVAWG